MLPPVFHLSLSSCWNQNTESDEFRLTQDIFTWIRTDQQGNRGHKWKAELPLYSRTIKN